MVDFENANTESNSGKNAAIWLSSLVSEIWNLRMRLKMQCRRRWSHYYKRP